ncbi:MAG: ATP-binding cassette domain-containing protein [Synergistaceae bacterium]|nr:ATP-binding cassette domain-containing protein [Synergistaceae bacterium]
MRKRLFEGMTLSLFPGEIAGLSGPSGAGKTTLGNILLGLARPDAGVVRWENENIVAMPRGRFKELRPRYQKIYQDPLDSFPPRQTIGEALRDLLFFRFGLSVEQAQEKIAEETRSVGLDMDLSERLPSQLSGGELQRFSLARVLLADPLFILADEPTSRLDISIQARTGRLIQRLAEKRGICVLWISHDLPLLKILCSRILNLREES